MRTSILLVLIIFAVSCRNHKGNTSTKNLTVTGDSVRLMAESIAINVSHNGPAAWLNYFENSSDFFMASEGQLVFPNIDTAKSFINNVLIKSIRKIDLHWSNLRVDPLTLKFAGISAGFHEDITDSSGKTIPEDGYFTAIAHRTSQGWKLRNAHWSIKANH